MTDSLANRRPGWFTFLILIIALSSPLAANLYLPSLPALATHFATPDDIIELTLTSFLFSFALFQLVYGPLSDRFGRRKILLIGLMIALIGSLGCALVQNAAQLIAARFVLGAGIAAPSALTRSTLRDAFSGEKLTRFASKIFVVLSMAPLFAILIGSYLDAYWGWQMSFISLLVFILISWFIVWKFFAETNQYLHPHALRPHQLMQDYWSVFTHPVFLGNTLCASFAIAGITIYSTLSPFLFQEKMGLSVVEFGWISALIASGMTLGRFINNLLLYYLRSHQIMRVGQLCMLFSAILLGLLEPAHLVNLTNITFLMIIFLTGTGLLIPFASLQALEPFPQHAGLAGGLYGAITLLISACASFIVAVLRDNFMPLMSTLFIICSLGALWAHRKSSGT